MGDETSDRDPTHEPLSVEPSIVDDGPGSALTPMGQVDSIGRFARGLGPRWIKIGLATIGGVVLLLAVLAVVS